MPGVTDCPYLFSYMWCLSPASRLLIRTLAQVDDFSENTKGSLSNRDCEAPVPVKILIGMELDVSVDNDTEPSWMKG